MSSCLDFTGSDASSLQREVVHPSVNESHLHRLRACREMVDTRLRGILLRGLLSSSFETLHFKPVQKVGKPQDNDDHRKRRGVMVGTGVRRNTSCGLALGLHPPLRALLCDPNTQSSGLLNRHRMGHGHHRIQGGDGNTAWMQQAQELTLLARRANPRLSLATVRAALKLVPGVER